MSAMGPNDARFVTPTSVVDNSATTGIIAYTANLTGFGQFTLADNTAPLPVTLARLTANLRGPDALLAWKTAQEHDNSGFNVERSRDGKRFDLLGFVAGHGTSLQSNTYEFVDRQVAANTTFYYRPQQLDYNGTSRYSPVVTVRATSKGDALATLHPNPAQNWAYLTFLGNPAQVTVTLLSIDGRRMLQQEVSSPGEAPLALPIAQLPAGAYIVQVTDGTTIETHRLLKQ